MSNQVVVYKVGCLNHSSSVIATAVPGLPRLAVTVYLRWDRPPVTPEVAFRVSGLSLQCLQRDIARSIFSVPQGQASSHQLLIQQATVRQEHLPDGPTVLIEGDCPAVNKPLMFLRCNLSLVSTALARLIVLTAVGSTPPAFFQIARVTCEATISPSFQFPHRHPQWRKDG